MKDKRQNLWHAMEAEAVLTELRTDMHKGLSKKDAAARRGKCGENAIWRVRRVSAAQAAMGEFIDLAAILLVITALLAAVFRRGVEATVLIAILAVSALIRTAIYVIAHRIFEDAARANIPHASVVRNGTLRTLAADAVVPGDILLFSAGDPVVADVRLLSGEVTVTEIGVTDNRDSQRKSAAYVLHESTVCEDRTNILFAGSTVIGGTARGTVIASGEDTYIFAKRGHITVSAGENLSVLTTLSAWCRGVSLVMIAAVLLITLGGLLAGNSDLSPDVLFLSALSMAVASMSEFLCVIAAIVLAVSVQRLRAESDGGTVLRAADSIEKFGRARCLVLSDARLLQSGKIRLQGAFVNGGFLRDTDAGKDTQVLRLAALSLLCRCGTVHPVAAAGDSLHADEMTEMLRRIYDSYEESARKKLVLPTVAAADHSARLHTILSPSDAGPAAYVCGELTDVLACCSNQMVNGRTVPIEPGDRSALLEQAHAFARQSVCTVAVATRMSPYTNLARPSALQTKMTFLGFCAIINPIEVALARLMRQCRDGGLRIVVLTESAEIGRTLAAEAGVLSADAEILTTPGQIESFAADESAGNACIFVQGRAARADALRQITSHIPETVYVGDRLQDIQFFGEVSASVAADNPFASGPQCLFSAADASVAPSGEYRAAGAADAVRIVSACKNALIRLRGAAEYLLSVQALRLTMMLAAAFFGVPMLSPVQLLWWGLILDFLAVLNFAFAHPKTDVLSAPMRDTELPSLRRGMLFPLISGVLVGLLMSLTAAFIGPINCTTDTSSALYIGGIVASFLYLVFGMNFGKFRTVRANAVTAVYAFLVAVTLVVSCIGGHYLFWVIALIPLFVVPVLKWIYNRLKTETKTNV